MLYRRKVRAYHAFVSHMQDCTDRRDAMLAMYCMAIFHSCVRCTIPVASRLVQFEFVVGQ